MCRIDFQLTHAQSYMPAWITSTLAITATAGACLLKTHCAGSHAQ